jgi:hypothetical protein
MNLKSRKRQYVEFCFAFKIISETICFLEHVKNLKYFKNRKKLNPFHQKNVKPLENEERKLK